MANFSSRHYGIFLVALSAVLWSTAGLFVRMADLDTWTLVGWRSLFSFLTLGCIAAYQHRSRLVGVVVGSGAPGVGAVAVSVISTISYVVALRLTTVANVMIVYAALPFIATAIAFLWLGERVTVRFLIAGAIAVTGIVVMAGAVSTSKDLVGVAAALAMTVGFGTQLVYAKRYPVMDMTIVTMLAAAACALISAPMMQQGLPKPNQLLACALFGSLTTGLAYILVLKGGRLISSGEAGLISMLDVVLGPLWVWLLYDERLTLPVLAGGVLVLGSVLWYLATRSDEGLVEVITSTSIGN